MQAIAKDIVKELQHAGSAIASAPEIVLKPDGTWTPFTGGRMASGAVKVPVLGTLPRTVMAAGGTTGLPATARTRSNGRSPAGGRRATGVRRSPVRARQA